MFAPIPKDWKSWNADQFHKSTPYIAAIKKTPVIIPPEIVYKVPTHKILPFGFPCNLQTLPSKEETKPRFHNFIQDCKGYAPPFHLI